ncbi:ribosome hibernation-promoting factor, HPF/YfiA family [Vibrio parahaemolyticus]|uniref:ribosome hibernation-promoting factor, HPF/YfiA family n=1 Tax=Vibrio parahaemolyticus TaxID=670 RepID=UPI0006C22BAE|nr:hypothetical protein ACX10_12550 [Vibrio parahaemolyticus]
MIQINSNSLKVTDAIRAHVDKVIGKISEHFHMDSANISYSAEGSQFKAVIDFRSGKLQATGTATEHDLYKALTDSANKVERQLKDQKEKSL